MTDNELKRMANRLRLDVVETVHAAGDGHPGPCMSVADLVSVLYFEEMSESEGAGMEGTGSVYFIKGTCLPHSLCGLGAQRIFRS